jgi:sortase A
MQNSWRNRLVGGLGQTFVTLGLVMMLFAAYEIWGKAAQINAHQGDLDRALTQQWGEPEPPAPSPAITPSPSASAPPAAKPAGPKPLPGGAVARLSIPKLNQRWVVVEGVAPGDIQWAPGHYPDSAMPGELGNFAVAGHRSPAIFWNLDRIHKDDLIVVETRTTVYTYKVTEQAIVAPTALEVVAPVPWHPGERPKHAWLTLTTCNPKWDNYERLVIHAVLDHSEPRTR